MNIKKTVSILLSSVIVLGVVTGCTVKAQKPTETSVNNGTVETRDKDRAVYGTFAIPDSRRNNQIEMQVDSVEVVVWEQVNLFNSATTTHSYIKVHVVITNLGSEDLDLLPKDIRGYIDNEQLTANANESAYEALGIKGDVIEQKSIHPGRSETGYVLYEYYRNWVEFEVQYKDTDLDFGIRFNENDVITLRTTIGTSSTGESDTSESTETSSESSEETSSDVPLITIPGSGNSGSGAPVVTETTQPSTQPVEPTSSSVPAITIPVAGGN